jgi:hypothetical protein
MATLMSVDRKSLEQLMDDFPFDPMTIVSLGPGEGAGPCAKTTSASSTR